MKDGGPAFPSKWHPTKDGYERGDCGMTLRDHFAAKAMQFCSAGDPHARARQAYEMADAMLAERSK